MYKKIAVLAGLVLCAGAAVAATAPAGKCQTQSGFVYAGEDAQKSYVKAAATAHYEKEVAVWRDPLTPPHTKTECCKTEEIDSTGIIICTGYCTQCQWMEVHAWLVVDIGAPADIDGPINECHNQAAAAGLITGIVTAYLGGGGGALDAAVKAYTGYFTPCLAAKIQQQIVNVRIDFRSGWSGWVGC